MSNKKAAVPPVRNPEEANVQTHVERIASTCQSLDIAIPDTVQELKDWLIESENVMARAMAKQGFGFIALKEQIEEGQWLAWLEENSFDFRRVNEQMRVAQMLLNAPETSRPQLYGISSKKKLIALASLPTETIEDIAETGELSELDKLSVRDMKQRIRQLESAKAEASKKAETAEMALEAERKKRSQALPEAEFPLFYQEMRHESSALSEAAILNIDSLEQLITETGKQLTRAASAIDGDEDAERYTLMAAKTLVHHVRGVAACAANLLHVANGWAFAGEDIDAEIFLSKPEIFDYIETRDLLLKKHEHEALMREQERAMPKKRGPKPGKKK